MLCFVFIFRWLTSKALHKSVVSGDMLNQVNLCHLDCCNPCLLSMAKVRQNAV